MPRKLTKRPISMERSYDPVCCGPFSFAQSCIGRKGGPRRRRRVSDKPLQADFRPSRKRPSGGRRRCNGRAYPFLVVHCRGHRVASASPERRCSSDGPQGMCPLRTGSPPQRPCFCRESWRGHGGSAASGLFAATVHPDKFPRPAVFLARQISRASRSFAALRPSVRRARTLTDRITPRPRWARPG
jgi:hypothetical protein